MSSTYVIIGVDEDDLRLVTRYHALFETVDLPERIDVDHHGDLRWADDTCARIALMDRHFWPPVNPMIGCVENGILVALQAPIAMTPAGREWVEQQAKEHRLRYQRREEVA